VDAQEVDSKVAHRPDRGGQRRELLPDRQRHRRGEADLRQPVVELRRHDVLDEVEAVGLEAAQ